MNWIGAPVKMKLDAQSNIEEKSWKDVESNIRIISDDDALLEATGISGELKRYALLTDADMAIY